MPKRYLPGSFRLAAEPLHLTVLACRDGDAGRMLVVTTLGNILVMWSGDRTHAITLAR